MNQFIKILCLSILASASANAMQDDAKLGKWLIEATKENEHAELLDLINQGAPVDYADEYGTTALMYAAGHGHLDCLEALIAAKAKINQRTHAGNTALMQAVISGNLPCIHALIHAKASIDQTDKTETTPLMIAASTGKLSCLEALLAAGANISHEDNNDKTALVRARENGHEQCAQALATAEDLIEQLLVAAQAGNHQEVTRLIGQGAKVDYRDENGCTALMLAASGNHLGCVQALIAAGAEVDEQDDSDRTALIHLTFPDFDRTPGRWLDCMKTLIEARADFNIVDAEGLDALDNVIIAGDLPCLQALLAAGVNKDKINDLLISVADRGDFDGAKALIAAGADLTSCGSYVTTALTFATNNNDQPMCELLVEAMLHKPTQEQKAQMRIFLGCLKYKAKGLWEMYRNRKELFRTAFAQEVYFQNKEHLSTENLAKSMAYQEVAKLSEGPMKQTLFAKYSDNAGTSSSPETKRAKTE